MSYGYEPHSDKAVTYWQFNDLLVALNLARDTVAEELNEPPTLWLSKVDDDTSHLKVLLASLIFSHNAYRQDPRHEVVKLCLQGISLYVNSITIFQGEAGRDCRPQLYHWAEQNIFTAIYLIVHASEIGRLVKNPRGLRKREIILELASRIVVRLSTEIDDIATVKNALDEMPYDIQTGRHHSKHILKWCEHLSQNQFSTDTKFRDNIGRFLRESLGITANESKVGANNDNEQLTDLNIDYSVFSQDYNFFLDVCNSIGFYPFVEIESPLQRQARRLTRLSERHRSSSLPAKLPSHSQDRRARRTRRARRHNKHERTATPWRY